MTKRRRIWVIEMLNPRKDRWEPTVGATLTREAAYDERRQWKSRNPSDSFRVYPYEVKK